jgi:hypothetical protein
MHRHGGEAVTPVQEMRHTRHEAATACDLERIANWQSTTGQNFARRPRAGFGTWLLMRLTGRR